jgi:hypothetical protein
MKVRKQLTEPQAELAVGIAAQPRDTWAVCPGCLKERRTEGGVMLDHRAFVPAYGEMVPCPGAGQSAMRVTAAQ